MPAVSNEKVEIELGDKVYKASYTVASGMITVHYEGRTRTTQLAGSARAPETLARKMLRELVDEIG